MRAGRCPVNQQKPVEPPRVRALMTQLLDSSFLGFTLSQIESTFVDRVGAISLSEVQEVWRTLGYPHRATGSTANDVLARMAEARMNVGFDYDKALESASNSVAGQALIQEMHGDNARMSPREAARAARSGTDGQPVYYSNCRKLIEWILWQLGFREERIQATLDDGLNPVSKDEIAQAINSVKGGGGASANAVDYPLAEFDIMVHARMELHGEDWGEAYGKASQSIEGQALLNQRDCRPAILTSSAMASRQRRLESEKVMRAARRNDPNREKYRMFNPL